MKLHVFENSDDLFLDPIQIPYINIATKWKSEQVLYYHANTGFEAQRNENLR